MKLCTYSVEPGAPRLGALCGTAVLDLARYSHLHEGLRLPADMQGFLDAGLEAWRHAADLCRRFTSELESHDLAQDAEAGLAYRADRVRLHAPIPRPRKNVFGLGQNYAAHAAELGNPPPAAPIYFTKPPTTVIGPGEPVPYPQGLTTRLDWEVELGVVIGRKVRYLDTPAHAHEHIAGYVLSHDVSERAFQLERGGQWTKGKSCDTFNPLGPFLATPEEIPAVGNLSMSLSVNGQQRQHGNTATMIFDVSFLVHYISQFMTLEPGDLISTGTPPGVGLGMKPPQYLRTGDVVELQIEGLGAQRQICTSVL